MAIDLDNHEFGDGFYRFALTLQGINEIEKKTGQGIGAVHRRVLTGVYSVDDEVVTNSLESDFRMDEVVEVIRQGLIGGKSGLVDDVPVEVSPAIANRLISTYVIDRPLAEGWKLAASILMARMVGYETKKKEPEPSEMTTDDSTTL